MATKSMLKNIDIKDTKLAHQLILALENASSKQSKNVTLSRTYQDVRGEKIKEVFGRNS